MKPTAIPIPDKLPAEWGDAVLVYTERATGNLWIHTSTGVSCIKPDQLDALVTVLLDVIRNGRPPNAKIN